MKVGIKPSESADLFLAFDANGSGGIDEQDAVLSELVAFISLECGHMLYMIYAIHFI